MCNTSPTRFRYNEKVEKVISKFTKRCHKPVLALTHFATKTPQEIREFGIKYTRYAFCCVALVGEKAISLPVQSCLGGMASCLELANHPFRRSHFHSSENALSMPSLCIIR